MIDTPLQGNARPERVPWAADNGCFSDRWDESEWWAWLLNQRPDTECLFATAPDVVAGWEASLALSRRWFGRIRDAGFPVAVVLQDGLTDPDDVPWDDVDAVFVGGTTEYKLAPATQRIAEAARRLGKWAHMGRVNSLRRLRFAADHGYDSVDGTFLTFGPDVNLPRLLRYVDTARSQMAMWGAL
jgi:hypothetical protein